MRSRLWSRRTRDLLMCIVPYARSGECYFIRYTHAYISNEIEHVRRDMHVCMYIQINIVERETPIDDVKQS